MILIKSEPVPHVPAGMNLLAYYETPLVNNVNAKFFVGLEHFVVL